MKKGLLTINSLVDYLDQSKPALTAALSPYGQAESAAARFRQLLLEAISGNPDILNASPASVKGAIMVAARRGLNIDGGESALINFRNSKTGGHDASLMIMTRGLLKIANYADKSLRLQYFSVYEGEEFRHENGLVPICRHVPTGIYGTGNPDKLIASVAIIRRTDELPVATVMYRATIDNHKKFSKDKSGRFWGAHYVAMAEKTVIRQALKYLTIIPTDHLGDGVFHDLGGGRIDARAEDEMTNITPTEAEPEPVVAEQIENKPKKEEQKQAPIDGNQDTLGAF